MWGPAGHEEMRQKMQIPKPKKLSEVPSYLRRLVGGFFYRLFYIFRLVWEAKPYILFVMIFHALFSGFAPVFNAYLGKWLLDALSEVITGAAIGVQTIEWGEILWLMIAQCLFLFIIGMEQILNSTITSLAGELVANHIKLKIIEKSKEVDLASFDNPDFYEKLENASREAGMRPISILNATFSVISALIQIVSFVIIIVKISVWAPVVIVLVALPTAFINFIYRQKNFRYIRHHSLERRQMNYYSNLIIDKDLVKEVRLYDLSDTFTDRFKIAFREYFTGMKKIILGEAGWHAGITVARQGANCALFLYIAWKVYNGALMIGDYSLYTGALNSVAGCVNSIIATTGTIYEGTLFINNMIDFMNEKQTIVPIIDNPLHINRHTAHTIDFVDVSFHYPGGSGRMVIDHLNLHIDAGDTIVLVGLNGAGKTTLLKLLTRLYDPTEGVILLDGEDIRKYDTKELYQMFGVIFQDYGKYAFTVEENISFGEISRELDHDEIVHAAEQSDADEFIRRLPDEYDTPLMRYFSKDGIELSGGQWQKLAIARAFYSDSDFLILDEPTASLDALAEQEVFREFDELRKDKTTIFVSHRLSSATMATKVVVLENGRIEEEGTHEELLRRGGRYCELFMAQASRYMAGTESLGDTTDTDNNNRTPAPDGGI